MLLEREKIDFTVCWFAASKMFEEKTFYIQKCNDVFHKQRLWNSWSNTPGMHFYFWETTIPHSEKTPF